MTPYPMLISIENTCNTEVLHRYCKNPVKWKVTYGWGVRYFCTYHKNRYINRTTGVPAKVEKVLEI